MSKKTSSSMPSASQNRSVTEEDNDSYSSSSWSENDEDDETVEVKGFNVFQSQENKVKEIFKKHQDLTSNFNVKNQHLKDTYMEVLLDLIKTLCKSTKDLSMEDLNKARNTLYDLTRAGFKVNWLRQKLEEAYLKREKQRVSEDTIVELKEHVKKQKLSLSDFETYLKEEKATALAAEARLLKAYPKGDSMNSSNMSMFLLVADSKSLPYGWRRHAKVSFTIVNQVHDNLSYTKETQEWFDEKVRYWGFVPTIPLSELKDKSNGFLVNGDFKIVVEIGVLEVVGKIDLPEKILCVNGTMDVNGFQVLPSQVQFVKGLFEKYPNIVSNFRPKNQHLKTAYMNILLNLIEILHKLLVKISNEDLSDAFTSMESLTDIGFKLDFLKKKIKKVMEKKEKEKDCKKRMREIEEELNVSKKKSSDLETLLEKEKQVLLSAMAPLSYDDAL